ncbi:hypothetical protein CONLIGDRAFT_684498 [Coniochaeta ligniaria NRRL 30616]|uniref:SnoaL-like domain-containing protein n=1 Tax=Coniochaeta ligniaria NRRL 30616 TaxID=1408157 RepID=A0A1J7IFA7_9PEZI|nr:hypothetical protein CONLIGDRAFT_684498 [Coniochaeta ligniaria NRRL 30616]
MADLGEYNPYSPPGNNTKDESTITALLDAYGSLSVPKLLDLLASNFTHRVLPESLGMPVRGKRAFAEHAAGIFAIFDSFRMEPREILKVEGWKETWVVRAHMYGILKGGKGEWKNECVLIVKMDDEGALVEEIQEFVDSAKAVEMKQRHAPKSFGAKGRRTITMEEHDATPAASFLTMFCWFLVCVLVAKLGAPVLALVILWAHPTLEAFRRSFFLTPIRPRL